MFKAILFAIAVALPYESLVGIQKLSVVTINRGSNDVRTPSSFHDSVAEALTRAGVVVSPYDPSEPELVVFVDGTRVDLELRQLVTLPGQPRKTFMAATWWAGGPMSPEDLKRGTVPSNLVSEFLEAWSGAKTGKPPATRLF